MTMVRTVGRAGFGRKDTKFEEGVHRIIRLQKSLFTYLGNLYNVSQN